MSGLAGWLAVRLPAAPQALERRIAGLVAEHPEWEAMPPSHGLLAASELLMKDVLGAAPKDRDAALDLLAADACVTYAFEAAADEPSHFTELADRAMQRIAQLAARE